MNKAKAATDNDFFFEVISTLIESLGHLLLAFGAVGWGFMTKNKFGKLKKVRVRNYEYVSKYYKKKLQEKDV